MEMRGEYKENVIRFIYLVLALIVLVAFLTSCKGPKVIDSNNEVVENGFVFVFSKRMIYTEDMFAVAEITSFEYEDQIEVIITMNPKYASALNELMRYVYTIHPKAKIKVKYDEEL